jgi:hypothetical protein
MTAPRPDLDAVGTRAEKARQVFAGASPFLDDYLLGPLWASCKDVPDLCAEVDQLRRELAEYDGGEWQVEYIHNFTGAWRTHYDREECAGIGCQTRRVWYGPPQPIQAPTPIEQDKL